MTDSTERRGGHRTLVAATAALALVGVVAVGWGLSRQSGPPPSPGVAATATPDDQVTDDAGQAITPPAPDPTASREPEAEPEQATLPESVPVAVRVPDLDVDTALIDLDLRDDGAMEVPDNGDDVGWYTGSPTPGETGPTVLAGHVSYGGRPGVFFDLGAMEVGQAVEVAREDGTVVLYEVTRVEQYPKDDFPTLGVYGNTAGPELRLITCGGEFDDAASSHRDNIVVYAQMVGTSSA